MTARVFIWVAHPKPGSLCEGLADAYADGVQRAGGEVEIMCLSDMKFESDGFEGYTSNRPPLEPDLEAWPASMAWANHIVVIHPYWWAGLPARAHAVLERALSPGFGFKYKGDGLAWDGLLKGRTGDVIITSDTPPIFDTLLYSSPGRKVLKNQVFGFCGIKSRKVVQLGSVKMAKPEKIQGWMQKMARFGEQAARRYHKAEPKTELAAGSS